MEPNVSDQFITFYFTIVSSNKGKKRRNIIIKLWSFVREKLIFSLSFDRLSRTNSSILSLALLRSTRPPTLPLTLLGIFITDLLLDGGLKLPFIFFKRISSKLNVIESDIANVESFENTIISLNPLKVSYLPYRRRRQLDKMDYIR